MDLSIFKSLFLQLSQPRQDLKILQQQLKF